MTRVSAGGLALLSLFLLPGPALAQADQPQDPAPAHLAVIDGAVWLDRQGRADPALANMPLVAGDRIRTERGRVEVVFGDGSLLHLDQFTTVDFQSDALLRLLAGRVRLIVAGLDPDNPDERVTYRIDTPAGAVEIQTVGDYRVSFVGAPAATDVELAVLRGVADLATDLGSVRVTAGARSLARAGAAPSYAVAFNSARWDAFDRWSEDRRSEQLGVTSTAYLPSTLQPYASTFDRHGYWQHHPTYGDVWYPRAPVGWRPYDYGDWRYVGSFGWTWIGYDPWAWPTHHYGRWGFSAGAWFWIPGVHWGPAWVSWAWAPGYVAWCPLGYDGWPVFHISTFYSASYYGRGPYSRGHGWNVVRAGAFAGGHVSVRAHGVAVERLDARTRATFVNRTDAPAPRGLAVPRPVAPIRSVGDRVGYAVPRRLGGGQAVPRDAATAGARAFGQGSNGANTSPDRRAALRAPVAARGLGAPPRETPGSGQPGLADMARTRARTGDQSRPGAVVVPRRPPLDPPTDSGTSPFDRWTPRRAPQTVPAAPAIRSVPRRSSADPGLARERARTPGGLMPREAGPITAPRREPPPRQYTVSPPTDRTPARTREYEPPPVPRRSPEAGSVGPREGARSPAPPRGGGVGGRAAPPRGPAGPPASASRGLNPGTAVRRRPG